jgi:DNA-binding CsgD family transcriptional regulator
MSGQQSQSYSILSERELEIVELVAAALTNEKIAERLEISKRTVDNHISNILNKTSTHNRVELVRWALQWGKVCLDQVNCCTLPDSKSVNGAIEAEEEVPLAEEPGTAIEPNASADPAPAQP